MNNKNIKILLINPKSINKDALPIPPLGILSLAAFAKENGYHNIDVIDNNLKKFSNMHLILNILKCDVVGVTGTTPQYKDAQRIIKLAKLCYKMVVCGGVHATSVPEDMLKIGADIVVSGEGENTFIEILEYMDKKRSLESIDGISFIRDDKIITTKCRNLIKNIDLLPFPARDLIFMNEYGNKELKRFDGVYTHIMASRGCGMHCTFCVSPIMWQYGRFMSAERIFFEMMHVYESYGIKNIHFQDDNFTALKDRIEILCHFIKKSGIDFKWSCQTRVTNVNKGILKTMKGAGCVQIEYGVESGDEKIIKNARKKYTKKQIKYAFKITRETGIKTYGFFIIGLPGENLFTWIKTLIFAKRLKMDSCVWTILVPFPKTAVSQCNEVTIIDNDYANWLYKKPVIRVGILGPRILTVMRCLADKYTNGLFNTGTYKQ